MNIRIIAVGKIKETYILKGIEEFSKRLSRYCKLEIIQVRDEKAPEKLSSKQRHIVKEIEADRILKHIKQGSYVIALP